jgi:hypothetical protein
MQCKASQHQFSDNCELWTMDELMRCGKDTDTRQGDPLLGVKKTVVAVHTFGELHGSPPPLLNWDRQSTVRKKLRAIIHEHIASYSPGKEAICASIPVLQNIIANTAKKRDKWDESAEGKKEG